MNVAILDKKSAKKSKTQINESDILTSLESAISSYNTKNFEQITRASIAKSKAPSRAKKNLAIARVEEIPEKVIKNKTKKSFFSKKVKKISSKKNKVNFLKFSTISAFFENYKKQFVAVGLSLVMVMFVAFSAYGAYAYVNSGNLDLVQKVGMHIILPAGETPKVYIIQSEKSEIFQNPLFAGIKVGDNVLTYTNAHKVIIYRSSEDKVVNIVNTTQ